MSTQLDRRLDRLRWRRPPRPDRPDGVDLIDFERLGRADPHRVRDWLDVEHVPGPAVRCRAVDPQAAPLADGEAIAAVVAADHLAIEVHDGPGSRAQPAPQEATGVTIGDEADVVAVGLVGHSQPAAGRLGTHLVLGAVTEREHGPAQLIAGQHGQHVGLVLGHVDAAHQPRRTPRPGGLEPGMMAGADGVETKRHGPVEDGSELDLLVAPQARIGRVAARVLRDEVVDDIGGEALGQVPYVEGDAYHVGGAPGVPGILERAAAASARAVRPRVGRQGQVDSGHLVASGSGPGRGDRRIDTARHGRQHAHAAHGAAACPATCVAACRPGGPSGCAATSDPAERAV